MHKPPQAYIIVEKPSPWELAVEVSRILTAKIDPATGEEVAIEDLPDPSEPDASDVSMVYGYHPIGSMLCHPAPQPDPAKPWRFSQPMELHKEFRHNQVALSQAGQVSALNSEEPKASDNP